MESIEAHKSRPGTLTNPDIPRVRMAVPEFYCVFLAYGGLTNPNIPRVTPGHAGAVPWGTGGTLRDKKHRNHPTSHSKGQAISR